MLALHSFSPRLATLMREYDRERLVADIGAGLTVGVVALPLAMAFAIASGVKPEQGIFAAIVGGLLVSLLGGSSVQIGGPAGAFIVIVYGIVQRHGVGDLLAATMLAGVLLFAMGRLQLGELVGKMPVSIVAGFTNAIAMLIALSQLKDLLGLPIASMPASVLSQLEILAAQLRHANPAALLLGVGCCLGLLLWTKLPLAGRRALALPGIGRALRIASKVPGPIVALVSLSALSAALGLHVETIGSRFGGIPRSLPALALPAAHWPELAELMPLALTIALLGAIESLLCARVADGLAKVPRHDPNQELMAQGIANIVAPLFGALPVTGTIARTVTNVRAGATSPVAGIAHAVTLLAIVLIAAPLAARVPLAVLAGILMFVAWNMLDWREFIDLGRHSVEHRVKFLATFGLTVAFDLTVAVEVGLALACVFFVARMSALFSVELDASVRAPAGVSVYKMRGSLFFATAGKIERLVAELPAQTRFVVLEADHLFSIDTSGLSALASLRRELEQRHISLVLCSLQHQPRHVLTSATDFAGNPAMLQPDLAAALHAIDAISGTLRPAGTLPAPG
ncbi:MAG: STAS domain-containing protein [Paucibacter sp.]|nr:STAS domain-containing protein [Roseateles sp.]